MVACSQLARRPLSPSEAALVTAVIPTRNRLAWLGQAIDSALRQEGVSVAVLVVDEGSSDGTSEWLTSLDDPRVSSVRHDTPQGLPAARNAGLSRVTTPWVAFLDDDDLWAPNKIRLQLDAAAAADARWCYAAEVTVDAELNVIDIPTPPRPEQAPELLRIRNVVPAGGSGVLVDTALLRSIGGFDEAMIAAEDWECWLRLVAAGEQPAAVLTPVVAYRWGAASMSMEVARMRRSYEQVRDRHPLPARAARNAWARNERFLAFQLARHRRRTEARQSLASSWRAFPVRHAVLWFWVAAVGREWPTRAARSVASRSSVAGARAWLARYR